MSLTVLIWGLSLISVAAFFGGGWLFGRAALERSLSSAGGGATRPLPTPRPPPLAAAPVERPPAPALPPAPGQIATAAPQLPPIPPAVDPNPSRDQQLAAVLRLLEGSHSDARVVLSDATGLPLASSRASVHLEEIAAISALAVTLGARCIRLLRTPAVTAIEVHHGAFGLLQVRPIDVDGDTFLVSTQSKVRPCDADFEPVAIRLRAALAEQ